MQVTSAAIGITTPADPVLLSGADPWLPAALLPVWELFAAYPVLRALGIVLASILTAWLVRAVVGRSLRRLARHSATLVDDILVETLLAPVFTTLLVLGLVLAAQSLSLSESTRALVVRGLLTVLTLRLTASAFRVGHVALAALGRAGRSRLVEPRTVPVLELGWKIAAIGIGSWALLILWGVDPTAWLASAGIVGIAVGFAAKDTLANLFSGLFIVADAPYKIGDYVVLDSGERGMVTRVGLRSTRLLTRDDVEVTVPNAVMGNVKIVNESGGPYEKTRIRIQIGVAYGSDVDQVCEILENTALSHPAVSGEPAPRVRMRAFGGSSLDFELLCWIERPEHRGQLTHDLLMAVYKAFLAAGIEIPYSKHDIYVKELPASGPRAGPATEA